MAVSCFPTALAWAVGTGKVHVITYLLHTFITEEHDFNLSSVGVF